MRVAWRSVTRIVVHDRSIYTIVLEDGLYKLVNMGYVAVLYRRWAADWQGRWIEPVTRAHGGEMVMSKGSEFEVMGELAGLFEQLEPERRGPTYKWLGERFGLAPSLTLGGNGAAQSANADAVQVSTLPRVAAWMRQNSVTQDAIESFFYVADGAVEIVGEIPGGSVKDRVINCYVLACTAQFMLSGAPTCSDDFAREICRAAGCLDTTNHTKYLAGKGNLFAGSKEKGWTLTPPGLKKAAALIGAAA